MIASEEPLSAKTPHNKNTGDSLSPQNSSSRIENTPPEITIQKEQSPLSYFFSKSHLTSPSIVDTSLIQKSKFLSKEENELIPTYTFSDSDEADETLRSSPTFEYMKGGDMPSLEEPEPDTDTQEMRRGEYNKELLSANEFKEFLQAIANTLKNNHSLYLINAEIGLLRCLTIAMKQKQILSIPEKYTNQTEPLKTDFELIKRMNSLLCDLFPLFEGRVTSPQLPIDSKVAYDAARSMGIRMPDEPTVDKKLAPKGGEEIPATRYAPT